jgi:hypothetical protein
MKRVSANTHKPSVNQQGFSKYKNFFNDTPKCFHQNVLGHPTAYDTGYNYSGIPPCTGFSSRIIASTLKMIQSPIQLSDTHTGYNYSGIPPYTGFSSRIRASTLR